MRKGSRKRVIDLFIYIAIGLGLVAIVMLFLYFGWEDKWFGLAFYSLVLLGFLLEQNWRKWRRPKPLYRWKFLGIVAIRTILFAVALAQFDTFKAYAIAILFPIEFAVLDSAIERFAWRKP